MHSSRMRTAPSVVVSCTHAPPPHHHACPPCHTPPAMHVLRHTRLTRPPPRTEWLKYASENITLHQTLFAGGKNAGNNIYLDPYQEIVMKIKCESFKRWLLGGSGWESHDLASQPCECKKFKRILLRRPLSVVTKTTLTKTRMHSSRMHTARSLPYGGSP